MPETPQGTLMAQSVTCVRPLHAMVDPDEGNRKRYGRNKPEQIERKKTNQHEAERYGNLCPCPLTCLGRMNADAPIQNRQWNAADQHRQQEDDYTDRADENRDD